jgi:hypothetical protein
VPSESYLVIRRAMENMQNITLEYQGKKRELSPHTLGYKDGREKVLSYQFGGESSSGLAPRGSATNWRYMFIGEIKAVKVSKEREWHTAPTHSRPQSCIDDVDIEVFGA